MKGELTPKETLVMAVILLAIFGAVALVEAKIYGDWRCIIAKCRLTK